jgi:hypothetical protein
MLHTFTKIDNLWITMMIPTMSSGLTTAVWYDHGASCIYSPDLLALVL